MAVIKLKGAGHVGSDRDVWTSTGRVFRSSLFDNLPSAAR